MHIATANVQHFQHRFMAHGRHAESGQVPLLMRHGFFGDMFSWQFSKVQFARHGPSNDAWYGGLYPALAGQLEKAVQRFAHHHQGSMADINRPVSLQTMLDVMITKVSSLRLAPFDWRSLSFPVKFFSSQNDCIVPLRAPHAFPLQAELSITDERGDIPDLFASEWFNQEIGRFLISTQANCA